MLRRICGALRYHAAGATRGARSLLWEARAFAGERDARAAAARIASTAAPTIGVFHQGGIGNGLLLGPLLQNVRAHWPRARVDLLSYQPMEGEVLAADRLVDRTIDVRQGGQERLTMNGRPYDLLLSAARTYDGDRVVQRVQATLKVGFRHAVGWHRRGRLAHHLALDVPPTAHEAEANNALLSLVLSTPPSPPSSVLRPDSALLIPAAASRARPRVAVHAGCSRGMAWKRYPLEQLAVVCRRLRDEIDAELVLVAGPDERQDVQRLAAVVGPDTAVFHGPPHFMDVFEFLRTCDCLLSNDSGLMHLAATAGCRVVAIFGPTDAALTGPWAPEERVRVLSAPVPCRPCYQLYSGVVNCTHAEHLWCLRSLSPEAVFEAVVGQLRQDAGRSLPRPGARAHEPHA